MGRANFSSIPTISSTEKYAPTILVLSLLWEKQKAIGG
jgi:hypothetical protein